MPMIASSVVRRPQMRKRLGTVALATALMIGEAQAQERTDTFYDGNELLGLCKGTPAEVGICISFVAGVADALEGGKSVSGFRACVPRDVVIRRVVDVVKQQLERYPERRHLSAALLTAQALSQAFPCR